MFTNSGMMQFVPYFLGEEPVPFDPPRAAIDPEVRAPGRQAQRHRRDRPHPPPPHLLRDARQLELRRLLPARGHQVGLGARAGVGLRRRPHLGHRPRSPTTTPRPSGTRRSGSRWSGSSGSTRTTSGRWARPGPAARARRSTRLRPRVGRRAAARPTAAATATSSSGTSCSCSTSATPTAAHRRCPPRTSTPAPASSAGSCCCRAAAPSFDTDIMRPLMDAAQSVTGRIARRATRSTTSPCGSWPTTPAR